jgi:hypothetical protein
MFVTFVKLDVTSLFVRLSATNQPPAISQQYFSQNKSAPAISHQPNEQAGHFQQFLSPN